MGGGLEPQQQIDITRNTIGLNGDGLGGINSVDNISAADANRAIENTTPLTLVDPKVTALNSESQQIKWLFRSLCNHSR